MVVRIGQRQKVHYYLREWRLARGWRLKDLAERVGVEVNTIWRWENEPNRLNASKLAQLQHAFDFKEGDSFTRPPSERTSIDAILKDAPDDAFQDVVNLARRLTRRVS